MAAATPSAAATESKERLELEDFEVGAGAEFDSVQWLNMRLAKSGVAFEKLDQHLSSLAMRCQLLCQDTSESIEVASNQLVAQLPTSGRDLERMREQALQGRDCLGQVLDGLRDADDRKQSGLQGLAEIDALKTRVETACSALREVGSWERKVRDCEQLVHSGKLPAALTQLASLKGVLDAFRMMPEYSKKEGQLQQLEENLLATARRRGRQAIERNVVADLAACGEVFVSMQRQGELTAISEAIFAEAAEKAWQVQDPRADASAGTLAAVTRATFEASAQAFRERWPLLLALDEVPGAEGSAAALPEARAGSAGVAGLDAGAASADGAGASPSALASAVRAALAVLSRRLGPTLGLANEASAGDAAREEEVSAHLRASRAVALLSEYVDGLASLASCAPVVENPVLWTEICRDPEGAAAEVLPWALLREVAIFVIWRPMQDDAMALVPPTQGQIRPSEAVLAAESNAKKLMQLPTTWARYLEDKGGARLAAVWLACVDATCESYWQQWDALVETFQNTLSQRSPEGGASDCTYDTGLLNECMQLHSMLHDTMSSQFLACQLQVLQLAVRMRCNAETPLGKAVKEKFRGGETWCERLATPSVEALRSARTSLEGLGPESAALPSQAARALPSSAAALAKVEQKVRGLVTKCCVMPVSGVLASYAEMPEWSRAEDASGVPLMAAGLSPLPCITAVGEHLFALTPQLERPQEGGKEQVQWLPAVLDSVVETATQKVLQIRQLSPLGAQQLIADLEYLHKVTEALGSAGGPSPEASEGAAGAGGGAAARLGETVGALGFLAAQQRRQRECVAKGEAFVEAPREGVAAAPRRTERALRAALGLAVGAA